MFAGRIPNTKRLNLASVGVETDALGAVKVVRSFNVSFLLLCFAIKLNLF